MSDTWHRNAIAVTGCSGSGKSTVTKIFSECGALALYADQFARDAVAPGMPALDRICAEFGRDILNADGSLNRRALGDIVFVSPEQRLKLEQILHPEIERIAEQFYRRSRGDSYPLVVYDCPLLFETGLHRSGFRMTILVAVERPLAAQRVMRRDGITIETVEARYRAQFPLPEAKKLADLVIDNSGSVDDLRSRVMEIYRTLAR